MIQREYKEMTDAELRDRLNQVSVTVQRIRFEQGREAYYHAKRWASEQNKPIRQELKRREKTGASPSSLTADGAGPGDSAPDADLLDYQREGSTEDEDRRDLMAEYRPIGA